MDRVSRKERLAYISSVLTSNPTKLYPLAHFVSVLGAAKSSLSEDINILRDTYEKFELGEIETFVGTNGGIRYIPRLGAAAKEAFFTQICEDLKDPSRILPGGFLYTVDVFSNPDYMEAMAKIVAEWYLHERIDLIVTVETKGVPFAAGVARILNKNMVIARRGNKLTEGSVITMNYVSGSSQRMQTMSLAKRAVKEGQRVLVLDDFTAGGGTLRAICDMMREFSVSVVGCGVAIATAQHAQTRRIAGLKSLLTLEMVDTEKNIVEISPTQSIK